MEKIARISRINKEDADSEPGCLCAFLGIFGFVIKQLWREIKAERDDVANQAEDSYFPKNKRGFKKTVPVPKRGRG